MSGRAASRGRLAAAFGVWLALACATPAFAKYYTYTDSSGRTHMVDGLDKVPNAYRTRARPWESKDAIPEASETPVASPRPDRPAWLDDDAGAEPEAADRPPGDPGDGAVGARPTLGAGIDLDGIRARIRALAGRWDGVSLFPLAPRAALILWGCGLVVALVVRGLASWRSARFAGLLAAFADRYEALAASGPPQSWDWRTARALEDELAPVARAVLAAGVGPTTVAAVRTMGGQAVDAGRVDALRACLADAEVADATRFLIRSAEGVHRYRARAPWWPTGLLATVLLAPRYLVWRGPGRGDTSGLRLLVLLYWVWLVAYALR